MPHTPGRTIEICHGGRPIAVISDRRSGHTSRAKVKQEPDLLPTVFPILGVRKMNVLFSHGADKRDWDGRGPRSGLADMIKRNEARNAAARDKLLQQKLRAYEERGSQCDHSQRQPLPAMAAVAYLTQSQKPEKTWIDWFCCFSFF